ncbi:MAG: DinB family protein [Chloroflexi bacterium]|nr:DinB family protein [Chloroflexota bacterium]
MEPEAQAYVDSFHNLWEQARQALKDLPPQALNWTPLPRDTNSAAVVVTHMCGSAALGVYQALTGVDVRRQRDAEFRASAQTAADLLAVVDRIEAQCREALEGATTNALAEAFAPPGRDPLSRRGWVQRSLTHLGTHVGHLQLTRQLWEARS